MASSQHVIAAVRIQLQRVSAELQRSQLDLESYRSDLARITKKLEDGLSAKNALVEFLKAEGVSEAEIQGILSPTTIFSQVGSALIGSGTSGTTSASTSKVSA